MNAVELLGGCLRRCHKIVHRRHWQRVVGCLCHVNIGQSLLDYLSKLYVV